MSTEIEVVDRTGRCGFQASVGDLVGAVLKAEGARGAATVVFVDEQEMTELNGRFRGVRESTDVLSFREADAEEPWLDGRGATPDARAEDGEGTPPLDLGEVIVCPSVVGRYAREEGADPSGQLAWTLVHGALHLVGYDHENDDGEMRRREQALLEALDPLVRALSFSEDP